MRDGPTRDGPEVPEVPTIRDPATETRDPVPVTRDPPEPRRVAVVVHRRVRCPVCDGTRIYFNGGTRRTQGGRVRYGVCVDCGAKVRVIET